MIPASVMRYTSKINFGRLFSSLLARPISMLDPTQEESLKEMCLLVDDTDKVIGTASKRECHSVKPDGSLPLHRAFSAFIFNKHGDLLLQKRSNAKITYAGHYTNSCCSHPIANYIGEDDETHAIGVKKAAIRRINYELGIPKESLCVDDFQYITRIKYKDLGNGLWGEHEIDYILFVQADFKVNPNPNEVSAISFVPKNEFFSHLHTLDGPLTPWFELIVKHRLILWWDNLNDLSEHKDHTRILHLV